MAAAERVQAGDDALVGAIDDDLDPGVVGQMSTWLSAWKRTPPSEWRGLTKSTCS